MTQPLKFLAAPGSRRMAQACLAAACSIAMLLGGNAGAGEETGVGLLAEEKARLVEQRREVSEEIAKAEEEARQAMQQEVEGAAEALDPVGLEIDVPPAPRGGELFTVQAEEVALRSVLLSLSRKGRFHLRFDTGINPDVLAEPITADLRHVSVDEALDAIMGMAGVEYSTGTGPDGNLEVLVCRRRPRKRAEAIAVLKKNAVDVYTKVLLDYPDDKTSVEAYFYLGEIHFSEKEFALAAQEYEGLLRRDPAQEHALPALLRLGACYSELGDYAAASRAFYDYLDRAPGSEKASSALLALARAAVKAGQAKDALRAYRRLLLEHPNSKDARDALHELADLLFEQKDYENALAQYELLRRRYPDHAQRAIRYRVAQCHLKLEDWSKAAAGFAELLKAEKQDDIAAGCYYALAACLDKHGTPLEALEAYTGAVERFPAHPEAVGARVRAMELYRSLGLTEKAVAYGQQSLKVTPPGTLAEVRISFGLGLSLMAAGEYDRALTIFEEVAQSPYDEAPKVEALICAGDAARRLGSYDRAELLYRGALGEADGANRKRALLGLGDSYLARGFYEKAALAYQGFDPAEAD